MSMFIGLRMDDKSTAIFYEWLQYCAKDTGGCDRALPPEFIYLPLVYSQSQLLPESELRSQLLGDINVPVKLENPTIQHLGETGNVSLVFTSEFISERNKFWVKQTKRFRIRSHNFKPRIPMSHFSGYSHSHWLKKLPVREITLVEEFSQEFNRTDFLQKVGQAVTSFT